MTSRERILAAINHKDPDRVPVDLGGTPSSGISAIAYANLTRRLGLTGSRTRIYDVVQQLAQPEKLKREFGKDITFWGGGCETRDVLNKATPDQVRAYVLDRLRIFAPGGGFVFNTVHNILPEVPPENVLAAFDAVAEFNGLRGAERYL